MRPDRVGVRLRWHDGSVDVEGFGVAAALAFDRLAEARQHLVEAKKRQVLTAKRFDELTQVPDPHPLRLALTLALNQAQTLTLTLAPTVINLTRTRYPTLIPCPSWS